MTAAAVSGAKRSLRSELKQRLLTMSAEERLRQSRLVTQKVGDCNYSHRGVMGWRRWACGSAPAQASNAHAHARRAHVP